jgi:hypothetical protein
MSGPSSEGCPALFLLEEVRSKPPSSLSLPLSTMVSSLIPPKIATPKAVVRFIHPSVSVLGTRLSQGPHHPSFACSSLFIRRSFPTPSLLSLPPHTLQPHQFLVLVPHLPSPPPSRSSYALADSPLGRRRCWIQVRPNHLLLRHHPQGSCRPGQALPVHHLQVALLAQVPVGVSTPLPSFQSFGEQSERRARRREESKRRAG